MFKHHKNKKFLITLIIFLAAIIYILYNLYNINSRIISGDIERIQTSIEKAALQCFSVEGFYPSNVEYLINNYGILVDDNKYQIYYETEGSNFKPVIKVFRKGS